MSGILGIWNSLQPTPWPAMLKDINGLGPDAQGDWHDPAVGLSLGRTQFFNTPESSLESPIVEHEGCVLVWSGRLDDRNMLLAGRPEPVTDAQLIIESYRRWGEDCLTRLVGEFVFILWDRHQDLLMIGCDKTGGRTIAYAWNDRTLLLCSRALTLLLHPQVSAQLDQLYLAHTLCNFWAYPPGITPFAQIKRLLPGHALILKSGHLHHRQIASLSIPEPSRSDQAPQAYYEQFWYLLNQSVQDRLRTRHRVCTTLSGGLDSTTITVALLNHLSSIDALSSVTEIYPEFDERQPIQSFLNRYPQVRWHGVNSDDAWALSEPWDLLPIPDDPLTTCTLPMNLNINARAQQMGIGLIFDGEWGDELFNVELVDLARTNDWAQIFIYLKSQHRWQSKLLWEVILPRLPKRLQSYWFARCQRLYSPYPKWLTSAYIQTAPVQTALQQCEHTQLLSGQAIGLTQPIENSGFVGSSQVFKLLAPVYGLERVSPLQDSRLIDFALSIPPVLQTDPKHEKIFLRQANQQTLPAEILWKPKDNYFDPVKYAGLGKGENAIICLKKGKSYSFLEGLVDFNQVETCLNTYRQGYTNRYVSGEPFFNDLASQLYLLLAFCNWYERVNRDYVQN